MNRFPDRYAAGDVLADQLQEYADRDDVIILALPRGGVPVAYQIARNLRLPLDIFVVRKLGVPGHEELALGAVASGGVTVFNEDVLRNLEVTQQEIDQVIALELMEIQRRENKYRGTRVFPQVENKKIILVDDGVATGATMTAAIQALRKMQPEEIIVAVPVAEIGISKKIATLADKLVCPLQPHVFYAVGQWYDTFGQTSDEEVFELLQR